MMNKKELLKYFKHFLLTKVKVPVSHFKGNKKYIKNDKKTI